MKTTYRCSILLLAVLGTACDSPAAPGLAQVEPLAVAMSTATPHTAANGVFTQTGITTLAVRQSGPNTILQQTSVGSVSGTLSGSYTDDLRVVIHPNGRFNATFTIRCECTAAGEQGIIDFVANDTGRLVDPTLATFAGRAVIVSGTGAFSNLKGVLAIEGSIDLTTGLSTYTYSGLIH